MHENPLAAWESFYVIVGSSAAALTGLQFVVMALVAESERRDSSQETIAAFGTPTVVHFCIALLVAAIISAPWGKLSNAGLALSGSGLGGLVYSAIVVRRAHRQKGYTPVWEDWLWHTILPTLAYLALVLGGIMLAGAPMQSTFVIGAAALLLVYIGIHNAWDTVTFIAVERLRPNSDRDRGPTKEDRSMEKITPFLWFNDNAEEAANFYVSLFPDSKVLTQTRYGDTGPGPKGQVMTVVFELAGQRFIALNGGPQFKFTEAISFLVNCKTQPEIDALWSKLLQGGQPQQCGWVKDKYGLSWQIVPTVLGEMLSDKDPAKSKRVMEAMLKMVKIDIKPLEEAYAHS